jgi:hypothetical protein
MLQWKDWFGRIALSFSRPEMVGSWCIIDEAIMSRSGAEGLGMSDDLELSRNIFRWTIDTDLIMKLP